MRGAGGVFRPEAMSCDVAAGFCRYAGQDTRLPCADDAGCRGAPWYVEVAGLDPAQAPAYLLRLSIARAAAPACLPDRWEPDDDALAPTRLAAAFPGLVDAQGLVPDRTVTVPDLRLCPGDVDLFPTEARAGEELVAGLERAVADGPIELRFLRRVGDGWALLGAVPVAGLDAVAGQPVAADGLHAIAFARPAGAATGIYRATLRRETSASDDRGCGDAIPVAFGGQLDINNTTAGQADSIEPLECLGGGGPDRIYAVTVPAAGTLTAAVEGTADGVDPAISIRAECDVRESELACAEDDVTAPDPTRRAQVAVPVAAGQTVYVVVDSFGPDTAGPYRLSLRLLP
ncbi:MAG: hypothetical protein R3F65_21795 [bacterium]